MTEGIGVVIAVMPTTMEDMAVIAPFVPPTPMDMDTEMEPGITVLLASHYKSDFDLKSIPLRMGRLVSGAQPFNSY